MGLQRRKKLSPSLRLVFMVKELLPDHEVRIFSERNPDTREKVWYCQLVKNTRYNTMSEEHVQHMRQHGSFPSTVLIHETAHHDQVTTIHRMMAFVEADANL